MTGLSATQRLLQIGQDLDRDWSRREETLTSKIRSLELELSELKATLSNLRLNKDHTDNFCPTCFAYSHLDKLPDRFIQDCISTCKSNEDYVHLLTHHPRLQVEPSFLVHFSDKTQSELLNGLVYEDLRSIFRAACQEGNLQIMELILKTWNQRLIDQPVIQLNVTASMDCYSKPNEEFTPLMSACSKPGNFKCIEWLLSLDAKVTQMACGTTALHMAASTGEKESLEILLAAIPVSDLMTAIDTKDHQNKTVFECARNFPQLTNIIQSHMVVGFSALGNDAYKKTDFHSASTYYRKGLEISTPGSDDRVKLLYNIGRAEYRKGNWLEALKVLSVCTSEDPSYSAAFSQRGNCFVALLAFDDAAKEFGKAANLEISSKSPTAALNEKKKHLCEDLDAIDHYAILGVKEFIASESEIRTSFKDLARRCHPDKVQGREELKIRARNFFDRVQKAYGCLTDSVKRAEYDVCLRLERLTMKTDKSEKFPAISRLANIYSVTPPSSPTKLLHSLVNKKPGNLFPPNNENHKHPSPNRQPTKTQKPGNFSDDDGEVEEGECVSPKRFFTPVKSREIFFDESPVYRKRTGLSTNSPL